MLRTLIGQADIPDFPNNQLLIHRPDENDTLILKDGDSTDEVRSALMTVVARLQTLIGKTRKEMEDSQGAELGGDTPTPDYDQREEMASNLALIEDYANRILMLERLIVESVRSVLPDEAERFFGITYRAGISERFLCLYRCRFRQRQHMG